MSEAISRRSFLLGGLAALLSSNIFAQEQEARIEFSFTAGVEKESHTEEIHFVEAYFVPAGKDDTVEKVFLQAKSKLEEWLEANNVFAYAMREYYFAYPESNDDVEKLEKNSYRIPLYPCKRIVQVKPEPAKIDAYAMINLEIVERFIFERVKLAVKVDENGLLEGVDFVGRPGVKAACLGMPVDVNYRGMLERFVREDLKVKLQDYAAINAERDICKLEEVTAEKGFPIFAKHLSKLNDVVEAVMVHYWKTSEEYKAENPVLSFVQDKKPSLQEFLRLYREGRL